MVEEVQKNMTFICEDMANVLFQSLYEQKKSSRFCDLTLYVNNKIIKAHRNVLACSSPYFDSILKHHKVVKEQLTINCLNSDIFNTLLTYMYTGQITIEHSNVHELLRLADHFIINKVVEYCVKFLETKLRFDNCIFTYDLTQRFKLKQLGELVQSWMVSHLNDILDGNEILELNEQELGDFLKTNSFNVSSITAIGVIAKWTSRNASVREKHYFKLLNCVQWLNIEQNEIFKHIETTLLYTKHEYCLYILFTYLLKFDMLLSNYRSKYDELHGRYAQTLLCEDQKKDLQRTVDVPKITVTETGPMENDTRRNIRMLVIKARQKSRNQQLLRRLMLYGLKPSLRMAALKTVLCKKKKLSIVNVEKQTSSLSVEEVDDDDDDDDDEKNTVKCPICFTPINDSFLLEQHLALTHSKDVTYKCSVCTFVCQYHGDYMKHMKTHFSGPPFKCDYCDVSTEQISKLIAHRAKHLEDSVYQCSICSFKCRAKQNLTTHQKLHAQNTTEEKQHKCDNCNKTFRFKHSLETHRLTHSAVEKQFTCDLCGFNTRFLSHMIAHKRIHTAKKNQMGGHARSHNGVRPHSCNVCGRGFMEKSHLVRHERIHLEEKPFKCSNCDYASSRRDKLKEHFTRHHGENASAKVPYKARPLRNNTRSKTQATRTTQESPATSNVGNVTSFPPTSNNNTTPSSANIPAQPIGSEIQELIMHHQNHTSSTASSNLSTINHNYHHFGDPTEFHHHGNVPHHVLSSGHNQRTAQHQPSSTVNHHMLTRNNHSAAATSTAAAVAAAMMLDPRFHHNSSVPYHSNATPVSMAMAAVQQSQHIQASNQHGEYATSLQNCMTLF